MRRCTLARSSREITAVLMFVLSMAIPVAGTAQISVTGIAPTLVAGMAPLDWQGKLQFHAEATYGPWAIAGIAAYSGFLQEIDSPEEWGQGGAGDGKRLASTAGWSGIRVLAFGLDSTLRQDPRYYRSRSTGFLRRSGHALRGTILTRTDAGGETCPHGV